MPSIEPPRPARRIPRPGARLVAAVLVLTLPPVAAFADAVVLKTGIVYRGTVDRDNTIVQIFDSLKRIILRDTKVAKFDSEANESFEVFPLDQPLSVHGGAMPSSVVSVKASPWDKFGRRSFAYVGPKLGKSIRMTQAIMELGPKTCRIRGVDGFWTGQLPTSQIPKESVLAILAKVDQTNRGERLKVGRWLIQAEWYPEARAELDRIARDFPDPELAKTIAAVRGQVNDLEAQARLTDAEVRRTARQPKAAAELLSKAPTEGVRADLLVSIREQARAAERQSEADRRLADDVRKSFDALQGDIARSLRTAEEALLKDITEAPDAVRGRLEPFVQAQADASVTPEVRFARALSSWIAGPEAAVDDLVEAEALWKTREALTAYLSAGPDGRSKALGVLTGLVVKTGGAAPAPPTAPLLTQIADNLPPPLRHVTDETPGVPKLLRVRDEANAVPTEYMVLLPTEYHPARRYPMIVALHGNQEAQAVPAGRLKTAIDWWSAEALRRGYIVIAPDYMTPDSAPDFRYTASEHAAIELAVRDAKRRFSVDDDRVYIGGQLVGGNAAWDFGLAHPDLFAGLAVVSGLPAKYAWVYKDHVKRLPLYAALGDLAPAEPDVILPFGRALISKNYDVTYVEYFKRGLEELREEAGPIVDWMSKRARDPQPKQYEVVSGRASDDRFYGVVIRDIDPRRTTAPEAADPLGKNIRTASLDVRLRSTVNIVDVSTRGIRRVDVWLGPKQIDFSRRCEVRVNGKSAYRGLPKPDVEAYLEDLRIRGDRKQPYWMRVPVQTSSARAQ